MKYNLRGNEFTATARRLDSDSATRIKERSSTDDLDVASKKERDLEEDMLRRDTLESNHHSARRYPSYKVIKKLDQDDSFTGLWVVESTNIPLPQELSGSFTSVDQAVNAIEAFINQQKRTTENDD
jgi:hypothetical protein